MVKLRQAQYCNLKLFLIFLVIYGHLIEPRIWESDILMVQYKWIYCIHMPLFCFLSGLFIHRKEDCKVQLFRTFPLYILLQAAAVIFGNGTAKPFTPWWHLWYLLSYCTWLCMAWLWFRFGNGKCRFLILLFSILAGCIAGLIPCIGRAFSLSRTLVFFPYFWAGVILNPSFNWKKLRLVGVLAFIAAFIIMVYIDDAIPVTFLYQAAPYESGQGTLLRLICYLLAGLLGLFLLTNISARRFPFSKMGANTMLAYLLHAPIVLYLRKLDIPWQFHILLAVTFLYTVHLLTKWHGTIYGIIPKKRRNTGGELSKHL